MIHSTQIPYAVIDNPSGLWFNLGRPSTPLLASLWFDKNNVEIAKSAGAREWLFWRSKHELGTWESTDSN